MGKAKPSERIKIADTTEVLIVAPLTHNAGCKYGAFSHWCTAVPESSEKFEDSLCKGAVLYVILKGNFLKDEEKYALFFSDKAWVKYYDKNNIEIKTAPPARLKRVLTTHKEEIDKFVKEWMEKLDVEKNIAIEVKTKEFALLKLMEPFLPPPKIKHEKETRIQVE